MKLKLKMIRISQPKTKFTQIESEDHVKLLNELLIIFVISMNY